MKLKNLWYWCGGGAFVAASTVFFVGNAPDSGASEVPLPLPVLKLDLRETTVSGISSGGFMAVQFGVAHSAKVKGVAVTAGGPYLCVDENNWGNLGALVAMTRCMKSDPQNPLEAITAADLARMAAATRAFAAAKAIDPVENLKRQQVWLFHGTNDDTVRRPVSDALFKYYQAFVPEAQIFYQHDLPAGHAQISAACREKACNAECSTTKSPYINVCMQNGVAYDAAGSALQQFYGPLTRVANPTGKLLAFDQSPYVEGDPEAISLAKTGYLHVPQDCAAEQGNTCRLHVVFHGCEQSAEQLGTTFVENAGVNEWADANRIVVLYPQLESSDFMPVNPKGCWDFWGYNDALPDGRYATRDGRQIAAVWKMAEALAGKQPEASADFQTRGVASAPK